jgi:hypothetical protein
MNRSTYINEVSYRKIMDVRTSFTGINNLFHEAFKYGDGAKC